MATLMLGLLSGGAAAGGAAAAGGLASALQIGGTVLSAVGAISAGSAQKAASEYNAKQMEAAGKTEFALATRKAEEAGRQKQIMLSRARAVGAASGGGQDYALMGAIEEEGTLAAQNAIWEGEEALKGRQAQAAAERFEGSQAKRAGVVKGLGALFEGGASFYGKYA